MDGSVSLVEVIFQITGGVFDSLRMIRVSEKIHNSMYSFLGEPFCDRGALENLATTVGPRLIPLSADTESDGLVSDYEGTDDESLVRFVNGVVWHSIVR